MSAVNVAVVNDGKIAYVLTDSAAYKRDKKLLGHAAKIFTMPHARSVIAARGPLCLVAPVLRIFQLCDSFDLMAATLATKLRGAPAIRGWRWGSRIKMLGRQKDIMAMELTLIGWSESAAALKAVNVCTEGPRAFEPIEADFFMGPPLAEGEAEAIFPDQPFNVLHPMAWPRALLKAMEQQRTESAARPGGEMIGGRAVLTTISHAGIQQQVLKDWGDEIGQLVRGQA
jgi:hypothetical protein